jgi:hypothetical protein
MCPDVHESSRFAVPDNVVKQVFEGRPIMLALLCGGLRRHYAPVAEDLPRGSVERLRHKAAYPTIFAMLRPQLSRQGGQGAQKVLTGAASPDAPAAVLNGIRVFRPRED